MRPINGTRLPPHPPHIIPRSLGCPCGNFLCCRVVPKQDQAGASAALVLLLEQVGDVFLTPL